jgi:predicted transcriptional regulator
MKKLRRDKLKIYGDLLKILNEMGSKDKIVITRVLQKINLPYDRLKSYIAELKEIGLIEDYASMKLTDKGKQYLREYEAVLDFITRMDLTY